MFFVRYLIVLLALGIFTTPASAQLELNPYFGLATGDQAVTLPSANDAPVSYAGDRFLLGVDVLVGAGQLAPLAGLVYRPNSYENEAGDVFNYGHISLPLGLAYRMLAADFDVNLVLHAAIVPGLAFGDDAVAGSAIDHGLDWRGRGGVTLYLGTLTLGGQYRYAFGQDRLPQGRSGTFVLTLGGRF